MTTTASSPPNNFICPITHEVFTDPVVASDGFTYERIAIENWIATNPKAPTSPLTNELLPHIILNPNGVLRQEIFNSPFYKPPYIPIPKNIRESIYTFKNQERGMFLVINMLNKTEISLIHGIISYFGNQFRIKNLDFNWEWCFEYNEKSDCFQAVTSKQIIKPFIVLRVGLDYNDKYVEFIHDMLSHEQKLYVKYVVSKSKHIDTFKKARLSCIQQVLDSLEIIF